MRVLAFLLLMTAAASAQTVEVVEPGPLDQLLNIAITGLVGILMAAIPVISLQIRAFLAEKSKVAAVAYDKLLGDKMEQGAIAIIRAEEARLKQRLGIASPEMQLNADERKQIVEAARPKFEEAFRESLEHFGKTSAVKVNDFLLGRVDKALDKLPYPLNRG